jgi:hypothetical protein
MTVLVSVKINDGVVMAADSASSFASGMVYQHADKIVNLREGLPIGARVTGAGGIGNESIDTLLKDLRRRFNGEDGTRKDWALDPARYRLAQVANRLCSFLFEFVEAMPIRDAVDLARFLVETTIGFVKFSIARPKTVGGSIAIAAITKHEGFQWVQRTERVRRRLSPKVLRSDGS